jgi:hypothetical protein
VRCQCRAGERAGIFQGENDKARRGELGRRGDGRLGSFCGAVPGQTHSGKSRYRGAKHARRGAIIAANYIYNIAKPDGLTFGVINPANYIDQLAGSKEVKFDWPKFSWIGSPERVDQALFFRTDIPYKTLKL